MTGRTRRATHPFLLQRGVYYNNAASSLSNVAAAAAARSLMAASHRFRLTRIRTPQHRTTLARGKKAVVGRSAGGREEASRCGGGGECTSTAEHERERTAAAPICRRSRTRTAGFL
ncbi:hypothetical protein MTO96_000778 [Rhipicephalus appendiculatus]